MNARELLPRVEGVLRRVPGAKDRIEDLRECLSEVSAGTLRVLVAGQDKAGKSTLVNVLLRKMVAPTDVTPVAIEGGVKTYPWGRHLLCDTMGYLADRDAKMPRAIADTVGRGAIVVFMMHWEGLCPVDLVILERIRHLGIPLIVCVNRMDETDNTPDTRRDIEAQLRGAVPWLGAGVPVMFMSLRAAVDELDHAGWNQQTRLPADVASCEARIKAMLAASRADDVFLRRSREHLEWAGRVLDEGVVSIGLSALKRLQEEVKGKEKWLSARVSMRVADQLTTYDKIEEALLAAIDAQSSEGVESNRKTLDDYARNVLDLMAKSLAPDLQQAHRDLVHSVRESAEDLEKIRSEVSAGSVHIDVDALAEAGKEAADRLAEASKTAMDTMAALAKLAKSLRMKLVAGAGSIALIELGEEGIKELLPGAAWQTAGAADSLAAGGATTAVVPTASLGAGAVPAADGAGQAAGGLSVDQIGNILQGIAFVLTAISFVYGLIQQRKAVGAARKDVAAKLAMARMTVQTELEALASRMTLQVLEPFDKVLDTMASRLKGELKELAAIRQASEDLLAMLSSPRSGRPQDGYVN